MSTVKLFVLYNCSYAHA